MMSKGIVKLETFYKFYCGLYIAEKNSELLPM